MDFFLWKNMLISPNSCSFYIVANSLSSPLLIIVILYFILWFIYIIRFMLFMNVHLNNCLLKFVGSSFKINCICTWYPTSSKSLQALIRRKISQAIVWQKWTTTFTLQIVTCNLSTKTLVNGTTPWIGSLLWQSNVMCLSKM